MFNVLSDHIDKLKINLVELERQEKLKLIGTILTPVIIGYFLYKRSKDNLISLKQEQENMMRNLSRTITRNKRTDDKEILSLKRSHTYLTYADKRELLSQLNNTQKNLKFLIDEEDLLTDGLVEKIGEALTLTREQIRYVKKYNKDFLKKEKRRFQNLWKQSSFILDDEQQTAIITDDKHNLVVAGAGSGKTEVLITRVAYLTKRDFKKIEPKRILVLAFQRKAAQEISERLKKRFSIDVKVKTFHSLGKQILKDSSKGLTRENPQLMFDGDNFRNQFNKHIKVLLDTLLEDKDTQRRVINFMKLYWDDEIKRDETHFETKEEFYKYMRGLKYVALDNQRVDSEPEREILNFFILNNINGKQIKILHANLAHWMKYEENGEVKIPKPDFFFPEHDLYWEHWAITAKGHVPRWFEGRTQKERDEKYLKGMNAKKRRFEEQLKCYPDIKDLSNFTYQYELIETSNADYKKNFQHIIRKRIIEALEKRYPGKTFSIEPVPYEQLVERVWDDCKSSVKSLSGHIANFITIAKTYSLTPKQIEERLKKERWSPKQKAFARIAIKVFASYQKKLKANNKIDFSDMINLAVEQLEKNKDLYQDTYDHILIDEYQDISTQRYRLIKSLMDKNPDCRLFCVGDDWQSIMGFSGSDLNFFLNFKDYFPNPAITFLNKNYRSVKSIVDLGVEVIKHNNPESQFQKNTMANIEKEPPIFLVSSWYDSRKEKQYREQIVKHSLDQIKNFHDKKKVRWEDMLILSRVKSNKFLINEMDEYAKKIGVKLTHNPKKKEGVPFYSVHKSKGLQAKIVFILNVNKDPYGFPCELENPDIYEPARLGTIKDKLEEERRLFYVAITRAKKKLIMYDQNCKESQFIKEIRPKLKIIYLEATN